MQPLKVNTFGGRPPLWKSSKIGGHHRKGPASGVQTGRQLHMRRSNHNVKGFPTYHWTKSCLPFGILHNLQHGQLEQRLGMILLRNTTGQHTGASLTHAGFHCQLSEWKLQLELSSLCSELTLQNLSVKLVWDTTIYAMFNPEKFIPIYAAGKPPKIMQCWLISYKYKAGVD